jgi:hypothetical protein
VRLCEWCRPAGLVGWWKRMLSAVAQAPVEAMTSTAGLQVRRAAVVVTQSSLASRLPAWRPRAEEGAPQRTRRARPADAQTAVAQQCQRGV